MDITTPQYIYLLHTREFINCKLPIYKIGRTKQANLERFLTYPKGFVILLHTICRDCSSCEKKVISLFDKKYKKRTEFGNEYYEGNYKDMKRDINDIVEADNENPETINEVMPNTESINELTLNTESINDLIPINEVLDLKIKANFGCEKCCYYTNKKQHYDYHCNTKKHLNDENIEYNFECKNCNKKYISNVGLWKHKKTCKEIKNTVIKEETPPPQKQDTNEDILSKLMFDMEYIKFHLNKKSKKSK